MARRLLLKNLDWNKPPVVLTLYVTLTLKNCFIFEKKKSIKTLTITLWNKAKIIIKTYKVSTLLFFFEFRPCFVLFELFSRKYHNRCPLCNSCTYNCNSGHINDKTNENNKKTDSGDHTSYLWWLTRVLVYRTPEKHWSSACGEKWRHCKTKMIICEKRWISTKHRHQPVYRVSRGYSVFFRKSLK